MRCRHCNTVVKKQFVDLGFSPPSNDYLSSIDMASEQTYLPLRVLVCETCWLVQTQDFVRADMLFDNEYAYFSSVSSGWLKHAKTYVEEISKKLNLTKNSFVVEVASNDGYLLRNFIAKGIPCLGIEPTKSTADASEKLGIKVLRKFFGSKLAEELVTNGKKADLIIGNNVYAHVPDINDFTLGIKKALNRNGVVTLEFPHLMQLVIHKQFDTIYHEHYSYLSLFSVMEIFKKFDLKVFDVQTLTTHGGSLRVFGCHSNDSRIVSTEVKNLLIREAQAGLRDGKVYENFQNYVDELKNNLLFFLLEKKRAGKKVAAYGAAAKGNTIINYSGIRQDLIDFVCDAGHAKQGKFMPGSLLPIYPPEVLREKKPDYILILAWNISEEVVAEHNYVKSWGGKFFVASPEIRILT